MATFIHSDSGRPGRRQYEVSGLALVDALDVDPGRLDARSRAALTALAEEVMALREEAIMLRREIARVESLADRDALCPVFNRRAFERELGREIALAERFDTPLSLVFIDLDRFKQVNDQFGHQTGDDVLLKVSGILRHETRETDIVGRLGGDEFGVALTHAGHEDSLVKAAGLTASIGALTVRDAEAAGTPQPGKTVRLGASCGVTTWRNGLSADMLLAEADEAMFAEKAKRHSRGR